MRVEKVIAERIGEVIGVDEIDEICWDRFMRVRVFLDVRKFFKRI